MQKSFRYSPQISKKVIDYLLENGFLSEGDLNELERKAEENQLSSLRVFINENPGLSEKMGKLIAHLLDLSYFPHTEDIIIIEHDVFSLENLSNHGAFLIRDDNGDRILCLDPLHSELQDSIQQADLISTPLTVMSQITCNYINDNFNNLLLSNVEDKGALGAKSQIEILEVDDAQAADANAFVYKMLKESILRDASDIHIDLALDDKGQAGFKLRYRVDGKCSDENFYDDIMLYRGIVNKLKLDASLKIDERRLPQDGRISFELNGRVYNFRLSFMPSTVRNAQEEKIVLRQMADVEKCDLYGLDILPYQLNLLEESITYPHGFICVTGPTGSGKTTTLYALLQQIDRVSSNVITLEDPIEAEIPLVNQSQTFHRIGYDFASGLRVILRQDPDIIMVGEMRDEETASKAFEAANTGHLVFSTLHTNTAASSITRLLQMNVPYYFISSSLKFVLAQRLIRRVCTDCRRSHPDEKMIMEKITEAFRNTSKPVKDLFLEAKKDAKIYAPYANGDTCKTCNDIGYKGRMGIMEIMKVNDDIRRIINFEQGNEDKIQEAAEKNGMLTIQQYGYLQVLNGLTTFEEVNNAVLSS
ncbi:GspE/PulE family protein [Patescibacteria group bacterium]|nr:GspE/PulE family protein [Patescibacteria group bacterium]MBU1682796.1 GspE/PulE family protein [Patescibacteria group bacterium]MBU1935399.1 GspE/PulE family protein [Patescibacteria group bacterium]